MMRLLVLFLILTLPSNSKAKDYFELLDQAYALIPMNPDSVIKLAHESLNAATQSGDPLLAGRSLITLGEANRMNGDLELSTDLILRAIEILPDDLKGKRALTQAYGALGNNFYTVGDPHQAIYYYQKSLQLKIDIGQEWQAAVAATQLVGLYSVTSQTDSALVMADYAEPILDSDPEHRIYLGSLYNNIGALYQMNMNLDSAAHYFRKGIQTNLEENQLGHLAPGYFNLAEINRVQGYPNKAIDHLMLGLTYIRKFPNPPVEQGYYLMLSDCYSDLGEFGKSLEYRNKKDSVQKVISDKQHQSKILELEAKYEDAARDQELADKKIALQENEIALANQEQLTYKILIGAALILMIAGIIFFRLLFSKRYDRALKDEKERMFSNIIHEIKTPLSLIIGPLRQIKKDPKKAEENFQIIDRNSKRLTSLVEQLLDVSKIDSLKYESNYSVGNLKDFIEDLADSHQPLLSDKQQNLELELHNCDNQLSYDFDSLHKICTNLLTNASKYSGEKSTIDLVLSLTEEHIELKVQDKGMGIAKKDLDKVFDRFGRADNAQGHQGVGIGLSLVKSLVELHGGEISVNSEVSEGSTFEIKLPVSTQSEEDTASDEVDNQPIILLVEDDKDMRSFISGILSESGFQMREAIHGKDALEQLDGFLPDVIISDVMMPEMDGIDFAKNVKEKSLLEHIPFIFLSARSSIEVKLQGLSHGADLYLEKPFEPKELVLTVQNQLNTIRKNQDRLNEKLQSTELSFDEKMISSDAYLNKLNAHIVENMDNSDLSVEALADLMAISRSQLHRKVKSLSGLSISKYVRAIRLEKALELLKTNSGNVTEIAYLCGFSSQSYFTKSFTEHFGYPPSDLLPKSQ